MAVWFRVCAALSFLIVFQTEEGRVERFRVETMALHLSVLDWRKAELSWRVACLRLFFAAMKDGFVESWAVLRPRWCLPWGRIKERTWRSAWRLTLRSWRLALDRRSLFVSFGGEGQIRTAARCAALLMARVIVVTASVMWRPMRSVERASSSRKRCSLALWRLQSVLERRSLGEGAEEVVVLRSCGVVILKVMMKWSEEDWSWVLQSEKVTRPFETMVVSMAEGLSKRRVDPRKDARVADPSLRTRAEGEERTASMSVVPAGLGSVQWPQ